MKWKRYFSKVTVTDRAAVTYDYSDDSASSSDSSDSEAVYLLNHRTIEISSVFSMLGEHQVKILVREEKLFQEWWRSSNLASKWYNPWYK